MTTAVTTASARSGQRAAFVDRREPARQLAATGHREHGAGDARHEVEEDTERGDAGTDADDRGEPVESRGADDEAERGVARRDRIDGDGGEQRDADGGVDHQHAGQGARDRLGDGRGRVADLLAEGGDAGVAGEGEEQEPGSAQDAGRRGVDRGDARERGRRARPAGDDDRGERRQCDREQALGDGDGAGQPADVDDRHGADRGDADEPRVIGPQVGAGGERERDARGGLADDEPPPGEVAPERAELTAGVDVGAARLRVHRGELGRGGGVAERDDRGDHETDEERRSRPRPRPGPRR